MRVLVRKHFFWAVVAIAVMLVLNLIRDPGYLAFTLDGAGNIYVGSNGGTIYRAKAGANTAEPWIVPSAANGLRSLFGVFPDEGRKVLWACSIPNLFV